MLLHCTSAKSRDTVTFLVNFAQSLHVCLDLHTTGHRPLTQCYFENSGDKRTVFVMPSSAASINILVH